LKRLLALALLPMLLLGLAAPAGAHKASDAYLTLEQQAEPAVLRIDLALRDLERAVGLDANGDDEITWGELQRRREAVMAFVRDGVTPLARGQPCPLRAPRLAIADHTDGAYAALAFQVACPSAAAPKTLRYGLLFASDPLHRGLLAVNGSNGSRSLVFTPEQRERALAPTASGPWATLGDYIGEGVWHIWIGFDHLLFLAVLLLPAALAGDRRPVGIAVEVVKVVTAFTVAHSITLALAVLGVVTLPALWVEAAIAASIVAAALANLHPRARRLGWMLAFGFGLVHGFGFAGVLDGLGLPAAALALALLGFNVGVELGQIAVVVAVLPLLLGAARLPLYRPVVLPAGSLAAAAMGAVWLLERLG